MAFGISQIIGFATLPHILFGLAALLVLGNIIIRMTNREKLNFAYNTVVMILLVALLGWMLYSNSTATAFGVISINPFSLFFMAIMTFGLLLVTQIAYSYAPRFDDFSIMASFSLMGIYLVASSLSLVTVFIGLELLTIPTVFMILLSRKSLEAATKLFIMGSIGIAILSFAIVVFYGGTNSISLHQAGQQTDILILAVVLFIAALGFEASIFPFNVLIPDVYEGSPAYATAMLGGINKKVGFAALIQIMMLLFVSYGSAFMIIAILSVLTMFYGNLVAIMQRNVKRMLAYSSISQAGYIMIGIATASAAGITAALFQIFSHMILFIGLLAIVAWLESKNRTEIDDLIGLKDENRLAAFAMALFMLSLIGLPFTTGFIGKFLLFVSAINAGLLWLAIIGIINSIISIYYYARPILAAYATKEDAQKIGLGMGVWIVVVLCILIAFVFGIFPQPLIHVIGNAGSYLSGTA